MPANATAKHPVDSDAAAHRTVLITRLIVDRLAEQLEDLDRRLNQDAEVDRGALRSVVDRALTLVYLAGEELAPLEQQVGSRP